MSTELATARVVHMVFQNDIFQLSSSFMHTENTARRAFKWKKGECVGNIKNSIKNPRDNHANAHVNGKHTNLPSNALRFKNGAFTDTDVFAIFSLSR